MEKIVFPSINFNELGLLISLYNKDSILVGSILYYKHTTVKVHILKTIDSSSLTLSKLQTDDT